MAKATRKVVKVVKKKPRKSALSDADLVALHRLLSLAASGSSIHEPGDDLVIHEAREVIRKAGNG